MRTTLALVIGCGMACGSVWAQENAAAPAKEGPARLAAQGGGEAAARETTPAERRPLVQLAILLDTSGSMDGLIEQAKTQLWQIVNEFATAKHGGVRPELQVALYEYGKQSIPQSEGYMRMIVPLSTDLDLVSQELFKLTTNGGDEYCGKTIKAATEGLAWGGNPADLRLIVIAGNEPFTQGDVDYKDAVAAAVRKGIIINTIHCGDRQTGASTGWEDGAKLGEGTYSFIDQGAAVVHIPSPVDEQITKLGTELNATYIVYGAEGATGQSRQWAQDANAATLAPAAGVQRAVAKSTVHYCNTGWDLVDAVKRGGVKLEEVKKESLPEALQVMTFEQRCRAVDEAWAKREGIQKEIQALEAERQKFIAEKRREMTGDDKTLGAALLAAMRCQAEKKGYAFEKP